MLCTKCGKAVKKNCKYCAFCGAEISLEEVKPEKKRIVLLAVMGTAALLFIVAAVVLMCTGIPFGQSSYNSVIEKELDAVQEIDVDEYMEIFTEDYISYTIETNESYEKYNDLLLDYEDMLWQKCRSYKKEYGSDFKIVYEITDETLYREEDELSGLTQEYNDKYGVSKSIEEAAKATVITEVKSSEASGEPESTEMCFIKIDGVWYIDPDKLSAA